VGLGWCAFLAGCESTGDGRQQAAPAGQPARPTTPAIVDLAGLTLTAAETALVADGTSATTITATLVNSIGKPSPDGIVVTFTTDKGRFTPDGAKSATSTTRGGVGTVVVPFISEANVVGTATVLARANGVANSLQIALTGPGDPARLIAAADATTISLGGTVGITVQVLDADSPAVADGTAVFFATNLPGTGVTPSATTVDGVASAIFSAGTRAGVATVTATAGAASAAISITIQPGSAGSLEFIAAEPTLIGVRGSALPQKATLTFRVRDQNGNPVADGTAVTFTLISGLGGGETLAPTSAGTVAGLAATVLTGGTVAGPVRVRASVTIGTTTLTSTSTNVSISGGPPSAVHLSVSPSFLNVAGQMSFGILCAIDAKVADRFGNPVPPGTAVSFFTNGGIVGAQGLTDALGNASTTLKTAAPIPHVGPARNPVDPRTGFVTVIAVTQGEETFADVNGNGLFDGPQEFPLDTSPGLDTPEPFIDHVTLCNGTAFPAPCPKNPALPPVLSGNGAFDPTDPFELFIDGNGNRAWDRPNGVWDAEKPIFASTQVLFSGPTVLEVGRLQPDGTCLTPAVDPVNGNPSGFRVPPGGVADRGPFCILAGDAAGHPLVAGTRLSGTTAVTFPDTQQSGPGVTLFVFTIIDDDATETDPPKSAAVVVNVTSPPTPECPGGNGNAAVSFGGTVE
jgi:adhesin/invasin